MYRLVECDFLYRNVLNRRSTLEYRRHRVALCDEGRRVLAALDDGGLAITHVGRFAGMQPLFDALREHARKVETLRGKRVPLNSDQARVYAFMSNVLGSYPRFEPDSLFARFACQAPILEIVNAYFGMFAQLRKYAVFRHQPSAISENLKWHRDGLCDAMVVRVFAYFDDISAPNGAMRYARGTHSKGEQGSRVWLPPDRLDERAVSCDGPAGTLVFADARGYHRAGEFVKGERWLFNCMFTSPGFGADYFTRSARRRPAAGDPLSWALSSPLKFSDNFVGGPWR
ncbi:phytanoyl-CoA dioxygenase family protein [Burkholderia sola]|uniref:phytanoyl-CoA dioxygenase family protein n=1 Tax=Burkholderia TaxID=32008 RepID=UPI001FD849EC|nr:phytanoyl-CoA dioxygenase family protein [Burkholderia sp. AcTa6-5]